MSASHRIARQSIELYVNSDAAAGELHAELSASFRARMTPVLNEVFTAVCPPDMTIRVDRLEIDAGVVPREGLMDAIASAMREQLPALLRAPAGIDLGSPNAHAPERFTGKQAPARLTGEEIALERLAALLEHGSASWRDTGLARDALEATMLELIGSAPAALRRLLERLRHSSVARRIWTQFSVSGRRGLLAWLGVMDPAEIDRAIADWAVVLAALEGLPGSSPSAAASGQIEGWLFEQIWTLLLNRGRVDGTAGRIGEQVLATLMAGMSASEFARLLEMALIEAERLLPRESAVRHVITERAAEVHREWRSSPRRRRLALRRRARPGQEIGRDDEVERAFDDRDTERDDRDRDRTDRTRLEEFGADAADEPLADGIASAAADAGADAAAVDDVRQQTIARLQALRREARATRPFKTFGSEPLWVAHAGAVIVWPFLPALFDACGLTAAKQFVDDAARERAVLLTAHVANGLHEWGEHDLLIEKTLCGYPGNEPIASRVELRDDERQQASELLASVIGHWTALKGTSVDGLRRAFLCRPGTMTAIASGWKLEIPRAAHDVLLDTLPWGIGLVLLPWMDQPLHVEW